MMSTNPGVDTATAAARRRQGRLRSWLRHERMTVAMTLAERTEDGQGRRGGGAGRARSPTGTEDTTSGEAAGCSERVWAAAGCRARLVPVLLSAVAGHAVSGGCDGRRGGLLLPPFPRGLCVGGQLAIFLQAARKFFEDVGCVDDVIVPIHWARVEYVRTTIVDAISFLCFATPASEPSIKHLAAPSVCVRFLCPKSRTCAGASLCDILEQLTNSAESLLHTAVISK